MAVATSLRRADSIPGQPKLRDRVTSDFTMKDGTTLSVKVLGPEDSPALQRFVDGISEETIYSRFLTSGMSRGALMKELSPRPGYFAIVAKERGTMVGLASYCRCDAETAEAGLMILDGFQGRGLGTGLIERIALAANQAGITVLEVIVDQTNARMIELVRTLGFPTSEKVEPEVIRIRFPTSIDPISIAEFREKWRFC